MTDPSSRKTPGDDPSGSPQPVEDLAEQQYQFLRRELVSRRIRPGTVLLETALSTEYGVSRTPIREALSRLAHDGFLERLTRGFTVKVATPEDILEIYETRIALESSVVAAAAHRRTDLELARLQYIHEALLTETDVEVAIPLTARFHEILWKASHSEILTSFLARVVDLGHLFDPQPIGRTENLEATRIEHQAIVDAIADHDAERARAALVAHLRRTRDLRLRMLAADDSKD